MKKLFRWIGILLGLLVLAAVALPFVIDPNSFRPTLEASLGQSLARTVRLGDLKLSILSGGVTASDLSISDDPAYSKAAFIDAKSLHIGVEMMPLILSRKLNVTSLTIERPQIRLIQTPDGDWNFSSLGGKAQANPAAQPAPPAGKSMDLSVKLVKISGARFSLSKAGSRLKPLVLDPVDLELHDFAADSAFPFSFSAKVAGGGEIKLDGKAGPISPADASVTPMSATLKVKDFDLAGSGWTQSVPGMGGIVSLDGDANSDGKVAEIKGRIKATKLVMGQNATPATRPVELDFAASHNLKTRAGRLSKGDIHIGSAAASLTGTYMPQGDTTAIRMTLAGPNMAVTELAAMLPALGIALPNGSSLQGGTAAVKLEMEGPANRLVTTGSIAIDHTTLANFDLGRKMAVIEALAGMKGGPNTEIQTLSTNLRMSPEGIATDNMQLNVPSVGEIAGAGSISPSNALDFKMAAKLHTGGMLAAVGKETIPFTVGGTCTEPVFRPDVKAVVQQKAKDVGMKAAGSLLKGLLGGGKKE